MARSLDVYVMRHLPTSGNLQKQYIGWTDESIVSTDTQPLSHKPVVVHTSDLVRTIETARNYFPRAKIVTLEALRELHFGDWEQKTYTELCEEEVYRAWIDDPFAVMPPGGESFESFNYRVTQAVDGLLEETQHPLILVVHGGVIRLLKSIWTESSFVLATAPHDTVAHFTLQKEEEWLCTSYSEVPITASAH